MSTNRQVILLLDVIKAVKGQVFMHNHRVSIYRPIIDAFVRHGFDRTEMKGRCKDEDPAFDDALGRGPQDIIRGRIR